MQEQTNFAQEGGDPSFDDALFLAALEEASEGGKEALNEKNLFDDEMSSGSPPSSHKIKYNGQDVELSIDELKTHAQKGMNYDKIKAQRDALSMARGDVKDYLDFIDEFPEVSPESIPEEVWERVAKNENLVSAYRAHKLVELQGKIAAYEQGLMHEKQNQKNKEMTIGTAKNQGKTPPIDPFLQGLLGK